MEPKYLIYPIVLAILLSEKARTVYFQWKKKSVRNFEVELKTIQLLRMMFIQWARKGEKKENLNLKRDCNSYPYTENPSHVLTMH